MAKRPRNRTAGLLLLVLVAAAGLGWWFRDSLPFLQQREATEVSPEAAAMAEAKLERLRSEQEPVSLSGIELSSLLRYRGDPWTRDLVQSPAIEMSGDTLRLSGTVATERLPAHPELDRVRGLLPDSARVEVTGGVTSSVAGRSVLDVHTVEFAGIPIPERFYPAILERLGGARGPGVPPTAMALPLPPGVGSARVEGGLLVLTP